MRGRSRMKIYVPSLVWAAGLFLLFMLVRWADFNLDRREHWTFAIFVATLSVPAVLYIVSGLVLPAGDSENGYDRREAYYTNRVWLTSLGALAIVLSFVRTYLLNGHIRIVSDALLKKCRSL